MIFRISFLHLFLFLSVASFAQRTIKGRVVHDKDNMPIAGASVFITNTSKGTTSDSKGNFELADVPAGKHELVISSVGFETNVFGFSDAELPLQLKVEMRIKVRELQNVTVEPSLEEGWDKWGRTFTEYFLGMSENAGRTRIRNEKKIRFRHYKKSNRLIAYCDEPLIIENKALGYTISYQLEEFEVKFKEGSSVYLGYSLFKENEKEKRGFVKRR